MALTSWKAFKFFDSSEVKYGEGQEFSNPFSEGEVTAVTSGSNNAYIATSDGSIHTLSRSFQIVRSFKAHDEGSITQLKHIDGTSLLVTVAEDLSSEPTLRVWALDKSEKKSGHPKCLSTLKIQHGHQHFPISAFAALRDLSQLAFGFANGSVTVVRGDLIQDRGARQRIVFESEEPITGIDFREDNTTALYISTTARILILVISGRGQGQPARTLDDTGCDVGCMTADESTGDVVVARDDAIYHYGLHGRGSCYNCDGHKTLLKTHKDYVVLAYPSSSSSLSQSMLGGLGLKGRSGSPDQSSTLTILNTDFHFVAHTESIAHSIQHYFSIMGDIIIVTAEGKILRYREKLLDQRLDMLIQRNLFVLAIQIAQRAGVNSGYQNSIFRRYGDYLYEKKDYDTAMQQYLRAIESVEPSQVIRKFLGAQRIYNLIDYLEELHESQQANPDHTVLLLNCYAKTKDVEKLERFIKAPGDLKFDLDTAISMCRQGGYFEQAAHLARKHSEHDLVVSVLIEDLHKYAEALAYVWRLEPVLTYNNLMKYATVLLEHCPEDTTQLLIEYYTGKFAPKQDAVVMTTSPSPQASNFASSAVQSLASMIPLPYMQTNAQEDSNNSKQKHTQIVESISHENPPKYDVPKPRMAFSAFVDHQSSFLHFLEALTGSENLSEDDKIDIYTTLFEIYLRTANAKGGAEKTKWEQKAKLLIEGKNIPIDASNVLLLSNLEQYHDGTTLVREKQGLRFDIFRAYTSANDTAGAIKALRKYGREEPQLYPAALAYFTSSPRILEEAGDEVDAVLKKIEDDKLMAPLQVIQTLSKNAVATMGLVKKYLRETIGREREEIANNQRMINTFRSDTAEKRANLAELTTKPTTFKATRCSSCGYALDQPMVHFLCQHSFHQRCLNIAEGSSVETVECPSCAPQNATVRAIKRAQDENREKHEVFKETLGRSRDGFGTVADWFGRGVMNAPRGEL